MSALTEALRVLEETTNRELVQAFQTMPLNDLRNWISIYELQENDEPLALAKAEQTRRNHL